MEITRAKVSRLFLASLAGCFFYAPPWKGLVPSEDLLKHVFGGLSYSRALFADLCLDSTKLKEVSEKFMQARSEQVKLMALIEGFHTRGRTVVPPASMEGFAGTVVELQDSNHADACKPTDKEHPVYTKLVEFIWDILYVKEVVSGPAPQYQVVDGEQSPPEPTRHFFRNQCRVLEKELSIAQDILNREKARNGVSSASRSWPQLALPELRRVVRLGKTLIQDCRHDELCHKAYLRQGERTQAFAETLKQTVWCMSQVMSHYNTVRRHLPRNPSTVTDEFPQARLEDDLQHLLQRVAVLQKAAADDQSELKASVSIWIQEHIQSHSCSAKECGRSLSQHEADEPVLCLAAQILARVSNGEGDMTADAEADHPTLLWKTSQEVLEGNRQIGKGSSATVFETTWLGDKYAKKEFYMVPKDFEDEANALARLNHPHIVKVSAYSVGTHSCFFLMEMMPGDLRSYMSERMIRLRTSRPFSMSAAMDLMLQIAEAMRYMNSKGMVHRDLKSQNILVKPVEDAELVEEGFVIAKLADFGLAKSKHEVTSYSHMTRNKGTRLWMAPEMFKANEEDEERLLVAFPRQADVYSFGIVCSEVLTGKVPFHHVRFNMGELYKLLTDPVNPLRPELPESCPESLASVIRQCWHGDPGRRLTFEEISRKLRHLKGLFMMGDTHA